MKILSILIFLIFSIPDLVGQAPVKVYARLHSVEINSDLYKSEDVKTNSFVMHGLSEIVEFGSIDEISFGVKFEILESRIDSAISYVERRNFYFKRPLDKNWKLINTSLNTRIILGPNEVIDFEEIDRLGHHNSVQETRMIDNEYLTFKIIYDFVLQWK